MHVWNDMFEKYTHTCNDNVRLIYMKGKLISVMIMLG